MVIDGATTFPDQNGVTVNFLLVDFDGSGGSHWDLAVIGGSDLIATAVPHLGRRPSGVK
jgi:hypothetical protein